MSNSSIIERWWIVTFASLIVMLVFILNHSPGSNNISVLQNLTMPVTASSQLAMPNVMESQSQTAISSNQLPMQSCIPLNEKSSSQNPLSKPSYLSGDFGERVEVEPATSSNSKLQNLNLPHLSDNQKQVTSSSSSDQFPFTGLQEEKPSVLLTDKREATTSSSSIPIPKLDTQNNQPTTMEKGRKCNIFEGKWIYDPIQSPLYSSAMCPFFSDITSCRRNGRPDVEYEKWRWEANDCKIPRFNAKDMLERLRGKRVAIIGDSINHSQFESLACLLYSAIPHQSYVDARSRMFRSESYDLVIHNYWAEFLVEVVVNKTDGKKTLKLDSLSPTAKKWKDADIMVFNTGHWWSSRQRWDLFQYKRKVFQDMKIETAFKVAMKTWARWIDRNVDTSKTTVFFRGMSPSHFGKDWCYKQTTPITDGSYESQFGKSLKEIVEKTIYGMRTPVKYLNITKLSGYRWDAHSSIYATKQGKFLIATKQKPPQLVADCSHWCLPGVPDTWNHLIYATMVMDSSTTHISTS